MPLVNCSEVSHRPQTLFALGLHLLFNYKNSCRQANVTIRLYDSRWTPVFFLSKTRLILYTRAIAETCPQLDRLYFPFELISSRSLRIFISSKWRRHVILLVVFL